MVRKVQRVVSGGFSTSVVVAECFPDANRLVRAYSTANKKGEETETLKHRLLGIPGRTAPRRCTLPNTDTAFPANSLESSMNFGHFATRSEEKISFPRKVMLPA